MLETEMATMTNVFFSFDSCWGVAEGDFDDENTAVGKIISDAVNAKDEEKALESENEFVKEKIFDRINVFVNEKGKDEKREEDFENNKDFEKTFDKDNVDDTENPFVAMKLFVGEKVCVKLKAFVDEKNFDVENFFERVNAKEMEKMDDAPKLLDGTIVKPDEYPQSNQSHGRSGGDGVNTGFPDPIPKFPEIFPKFHG
jgi:nitrogen fixation-related uncharacterized protein